VNEEPAPDYQQELVESLDLTDKPRDVIRKARRRSLTSVYAALAMTAPPGFMGTAEAMMGSPYKSHVRQRELGPFEYDDWVEANYEELNIAAAESGADREIGFDFDYFAQHRYDEYVGTYWRDNPLAETFRKAEEKRQRRLERNKRNRPIRGSL